MVDVTKNIVILGSTGSIGTSSLEVIRSLLNEGMEMDVHALAAGSNIELLVKQACEFKPRQVSIADEELVPVVKEQFGELDIDVLWGPQGLVDLVTDPFCDTVINGLVGAAGLVPTLEALGSGKKVLLANKETIVMAGELVMNEIRRSHGFLVPIDSEMSAIFQCFDENTRKDVSRIVLTASGGPFYNLSQEEMEKVTIKDALDHPTWKMGTKNTIDSATLMNKGLEVIEARWLFGLESCQIDVVIHRKSIVHSFVEFIDNSILAQLSQPDMRLPIQYAITFPGRLPSTYGGLDFSQSISLEFEPPDYERFPCLELAFKALEMGGDATTCLNAANDVCVDAFGKGLIGFMDIPRLIEKCLMEHNMQANVTLNDILKTDRMVRESCKKLINNNAI